MELSQEYTSDIEPRYRYLIIFIALFILIVVGRLYYLQVIRGSFYRFFSTENSIKEMKIPAVRGMIFDRKGRVLVESRPAFELVITPQYVADPPKVFSTLNSLLGIPVDELESIWAIRGKQPRYKPLLIRDDITPEQVAIIKARKNPWDDESVRDDLRGVNVRVQYKRSYPKGNVATHVLGYVREIDADRLMSYKQKYPDNYFIGDHIGIIGIEEAWDLELRGRDGFDQRVVDAVGREVDYEGIADQLEHSESIGGMSLVLTIDSDLQELARDMFGEKSGAVVAINPNNGAILTMYSSPSYDLDKLFGPDGDDYWKKISTDPKGYLINRAMQGAYPPGSTYKIVTGIAALSEGKVTPDEKIGCSGGLPYGGRVYHCWARGGHGPVSFHRSLVHSCDVYYYVMGLRLGPDLIAKYANELGLGKKTGIELTGERSGLIPTEGWKERRFGVPWQKGENLSIAVGQGYDLVTPLQNVKMIAQVVNGGYRIYPHLMEAAYDPDGHEVYKWKPPREKEKIDIPSEVLELAKKALAGVVQEGGTAARLAAFEVEMGGKTGTAQVVSLDSACIGETCRDHAWFVGFAPTDKPEIAVAAVVEHGGFGATAAAPIVGALIQRYMDITHGTQSEHPALKYLYEKKPEPRGES